jgi:hypothetical protein
MSRKTPITTTVTDPTGRVLAEDKGDGQGLQEVGDNLKQSMAEMVGLPTRWVLYDEHGGEILVPTGQDGKIVFNRTGTEMLKHDFSDKERAELSARAGQIDKNASELEARLSSLKKQMQGEIDSDRAEVSNILQKCRDGYEFRDFRTGTILHCPTKGKKIIVRLDNEQVVKVLDMAPHEFQTEMFAETPAEGVGE